MDHVCDLCGFSSSNLDDFTTPRRSFSRRRHTICHACSHRFNLRQQRNARRLSWTVNGLCLTVLLVFSMTKALWFVGFLLIIYACTWALTIVHEFGHALATWCMCGRVIMIISGAGPLLYRGLWGRCRVVIRWLPAGGAAFIGFASPRAIRWRHAASIAGGPLANFAVAAAIAAMLTTDQLLSTGAAQGVYHLAPILCWTSVAQGLIAIIPATTATPFGQLKSDGGQLIADLLGAAGRSRDLHREGFIIEATGALSDGDADTAQSLIDQAAHHYGLNDNLRFMRIQAAMVRDDLAEAEHMISDMLDTGVKTPALLPYLHAFRACCLLMIDDHRLHEADADSARAIQIRDDDASILMIRGAVFVAQGDWEQAQTLLDRARNLTSHPATDAAISAYSAVIAHHRGDLAERDRLLAAARRQPMAATDLRWAQRQIDATMTVVDNGHQAISPCEG
jgi:hypothetical protein